MKKAVPIIDKELCCRALTRLVKRRCPWPVREAGAFYTGIAAMPSRDLELKYHRSFFLQDQQDVRHVVNVLLPSISGILDSRKSTMTPTSLFAKESSYNRSSMTFG